MEERSVVCSYRSRCLTLLTIHLKSGDPGLETLIRLGYFHFHTQKQTACPQAFQLR